ncbi:MAG: hypothetical protein KBC96_11630 [Armatimonadetes bacterium]|nr:hypothetical protein [Armatimonadota bacterium]
MSNRSQKRLPIAIVAVLLLAVVAVFYAVHNRSGSQPAAFVVLPNAEGPEFVTFQGTRQMRYEFIEPYPGKAALKGISDRLGRLGWKPLQNSYLQPDRPSSHVTGWEEFQDGTKTPWVYVRQWMGEWTSPSGDVVSYILRYEWPNDASAPNTDRVRLNSILIPAKVAASRRAALPKGTNSDN